MATVDEARRNHQAPFAAKPAVTRKPTGGVWIEHGASLQPASYGRVAVQSARTTVHRQAPPAEWPQADGLLHPVEVTTRRIRRTSDQSTITETAAK